MWIIICEDKEGIAIIRRGCESTDQICQIRTPLGDVDIHLFLQQLHKKVKKQQDTQHLSGLQLFERPASLGIMGAQCSYDPLKPQHYRIERLKRGH